MTNEKPLDEGNLDDLFKNAEKYLNPLNAIKSMFIEAEKVNAAFVQGRVRLDEMNDAVAKTASSVIRLGGEVTDVTLTITKIAEGSKRNIIATKEQVTELFAASKILSNIDTSVLVENFANVGYEVSQIAPNLKESIGYIQSIGLNAKTVMDDVNANMGQMNRYQFEGGVAGLTKMAAQASMLRFDMKETFSFAEKVLSPEGAIETAAAFQRLGVSIGNLSDPFVLMNSSINDPSGLQDSLINATKQFTEYDEKTKSFRINPQGVLTLRELAKETNTTFENLSKSALAASELDKRLSEVSAAGLRFESEEDKQYLANIARMGEGGKYEVELKDGVTKELQNLNQEEFDRLIEEQKKVAKETGSLEDIQKSQLLYTKNIESLLKSLVARGTYGLAGTSFIRGNLVDADRISREVASSAEKRFPSTSNITKELNSSINKMSELYRQREEGKISGTSFEESLKKMNEEISSKISSYGKNAKESVKDIVSDILKQKTSNDGSNFQIKDFINKNLYKESLTTQISETPKTGKTVEPLSRDRFFGTQPKTQNITKTTQLTSQVDFGGTITIKVDAPPGVSEQQFKTFFESEEFKKKIYEYYNQKAKELERK